MSAVCDRFLHDVFLYGFLHVSNQRELLQTIIFSLAYFLFN